MRIMTIFLAYRYTDTLIDFQLAYHSPIIGLSKNYSYYYHPLIMELCPCFINYHDLTPWTDSVPITAWHSCRSCHLLIDTLVLPRATKLPSKIGLCLLIMPIISAYRWLIYWLILYSTEKMCWTRTNALVHICTCSKPSELTSFQLFILPN